MTSLYSRQELNEENSSAVFAVYRVLRRQPWDQWTRKALDMMKSMLQSTVLAVSLSALLLPLAAHARQYDVFGAEVPFKFNIGERTFSPGHYDFIFAGPGLIAVRDSRARVIGTFVVRSIAADAPAPSSKLVFRHDKKRQYLKQIWLQSRTEFTEILGEELAMPTLEPPLPVLPLNSLFGDRQNVPRLKE